VTTCLLLARHSLCQLWCGLGPWQEQPVWE
jgi:hypothetical protein